MPDIEISFRTHQEDVIPRKIWQQLFNLYREHGGPLDNMDNILIDLRNCEQIMSDIGGEDITKRFLFGFNYQNYMTTWIPEEKWIDPDCTKAIQFLSHDFFVLCEVSRDGAKFTWLTDETGS